MNPWYSLCKPHIISPPIYNTINQLATQSSQIPLARQKYCCDSDPESPNLKVRTLARRHVVGCFSQWRFVDCRAKIDILVGWLLLATPWGDWKTSLAFSDLPLASAFRLPMWSIHAETSFLRGSSQFVIVLLNVTKPDSEIIWRVPHSDETWTCKYSRLYRWRTSDGINCNSLLERFSCPDDRASLQ